VDLNYLIVPLEVLVAQANLLLCLYQVRAVVAEAPITLQAVTEVQAEGAIQALLEVLLPHRVKEITAAMELLFRAVTLQVVAEALGGLEKMLHFLMLAVTGGQELQAILLVGLLLMRAVELELVMG
jgi:hypothetical protein